MQNGAVDIVQVTLVVNLGHAGANTGANLAAGVAGPGSGSIGSAGAQASSGDATATGNHTNTSLTQSAIVLSGETSMQIATVLNIGIGVGNSGMNLAVANVIMNAAASAALGGNSSAASVATGGANATGNRTTTTIAQTAAGVATGNSTLSIKQRALVLNLGIAFANSGANAALSGLGVDEQAELLTQIVAFLDPLFEQFGLYTDDFVGGVGGGAVAGVQTGTASAVGNDATTTISQNIVGTSRGDATTQASQLAVVANFGFALSNTGLNVALAQIGDGQSMAPARVTATDSELARFFSLLHDLDWLTSGNPFASFAETIELDGLTLNFGGDISGVEYLVGWDEDAFPDGGPIPGGVRVRQITAVIDISYAWSNSGRNVAVALVTGSNMVSVSETDEVFAALRTSDVGLLAVAAGTGAATASAGSGDALAIGNDAVIVICQTFRDSLACVRDEPEPSGNPTTPPVVTPLVVTSAAATPSVPNVAVPAVVPIAVAKLVALPAQAPAAHVAAAAEDAATLPFTGGDAQSLAWRALALIGLGGLLARRRVFGRHVSRGETR